MDIHQGGSAARRVYDTLELRREIFDLLDQNTLVTLFRLEKGVVTSVAELVYDEVHIDQMRRFKRTNPRHAVYLDSVRVLDRTPPSPPPDDTSVDIDRKREEYRYLVDTRPVPFKLREVLRRLSTLRERFRQVQTVLYRPPSDDAYDIRLHGETTFVDLESRVLLDTYDRPPTHSSAFPATPTQSGMVFNHRIIIRLGDKYQLYNRYRGRLGPWPREQLELSRLWTSWLFTKSLDRRVVHIELPAWIDVTFDVVMKWLESRQGEEYEPVTSVVIPWPTIASSDSLRRVGALRLSELSSLALRIPSFISIPAGYLQGLIDSLDTAFPALQRLDMGILPEDVTPLHGLPNLVLLRCGPSDIQDEVACANAALVVRDLGSAACVYEANEEEASGSSAGYLNMMVQMLKARK